jgi:hypothetical protein
MGIIYVSLVTANVITDGATMPDWIPLCCYSAIALGTMSGGWKIVKTMGTKITKITPLEGVAAESAGAITLTITERLGIPVSTTHTITGSIIGVGLTKRVSAVRWGVTINLMWAWIITIPISALLAAGVYCVIPRTGLNLLALSWLKLYMKKILLLIPVFFVLSTLSGCDTLNQVAQTAGTQLGNPSAFEIASALKQALEQGTDKSSDQLSATNGFFGNAVIKILMPPEAQKAEKTLRSIGLNSLCDNVILSLNRAAESAAKEAKPIFINSIKQLTLQDATNILFGNKDAATSIF